MLQRFVSEHAGLVIAAFALCALACATQLGALRIDSTVDNLMVDDDVTRRLNREAKIEFSDDEVILVGLDAGKPLDAGVVREIAALSARIGRIPGVEEVLDLSTIEDVRARGDDIDASPLVDIEKLDAEIASIRARAIGHRIYDRNILSADGEQHLLVVYLEVDSDGIASKIDVAREVHAVVDGWRESTPLYLTGGPALEYELNSEMSRDLALLMPLGFLVIAVLIYAATGRFAAIGTTIAAIAWSELVTFGFMSAAGIAISTVTSIVPVMTLAVSSTYAIYFLGMVRNSSKERDPGIAAIARMARPALLSAGSTGIGFASLLLIGIEGIDDLGATLVVAIGAAYSASMLLLPALAHSWRLRIAPPAGDRGARIGRIGLRFAETPRTTLALTALLVSIAGFGVVHLRITSAPVSLLDPQGAVVRGDKFLGESFGGTTVLRLVVDTNEVDGAVDPVVLGFLERTIERIEVAPRVVRTQSILDYFYLMDAAMRPERDPRSVPESRALASQYLLLYESSGDRSDLRHYLNYDRSALSVTIKAHTRTTEATMAVARTVEAAASDAPEGVQVHVIGNAVLMARALNAITRGMMIGLGTAAALICGTLGVLLGSCRLALLAMIPNLIPVVCAIGLLGWSGVPLSVGTSIIGAMVLGLAVDDTAHVFGHLDRRKDLRSTFAVVGESLLLTSIALGLGFGVLTLSHLAVVATIGWTMLFTMALALVADLIVLPSLLVLAGYELDRVGDGEVARAETPTVFSMSEGDGLLKTEIARMIERREQNPDGGSQS